MGMTQWKRSHGSRIKEKGLEEKEKRFPGGDRGHYKMTVGRERVGIATSNFEEYI